MADRDGCQPSPVSPLCSPVSSESPSPGTAPANVDHASLQRLLALLTKPREEGGYGGFVTFTEFTAMTRPLHWQQEDVEDCWYDIVRGVPTPEVKDMSRVAELVCRYGTTSSSGVPTAAHEAHDQGKDPALLPTGTPHSVKRASSRHEVIETSDVAVQAGGWCETQQRAPPCSSSLALGQCSDGGVDSPKSSSVSSASLSVSPLCTTKKRMPATAGKVKDRTPTRGRQPASPRRSGARSTAHAPALVAGRVTGNTPLQERRSPSRHSLLSASVKRFCAPTESSRRRCAASPTPRARHKEDAPLPPARRDASPTQHKEGAETGVVALRTTNPTTTEKQEAVFERLYALAKTGKGRQPTPTRGEKTVATGTNTEEAELRECTFRPSITPYRSTRPDSERSRQTDSYRKATRSSLSRLLGQEAHYDPLLAAPETPRVAVRPAPGPSAHVPPGYVEGVARLRSGMLHRSRSPSMVAFSESLREAPVSPSRQASEERRRQQAAAFTPILRLPLSEAEPGASDKYTGEGGRACIDVRLATPPRRRVAGRHGTNPSANTSCLSHNSFHDSPSGQPSPSRSAGSSRGLPNRFREHPQLYYASH